MISYAAGVGFLNRLGQLAFFGRRWPPRDLRLREAPSVAQSEQQSAIAAVSCCLYFRRRADSLRRVARIASAMRAARSRAM